MVKFDKEVIKRGKQYFNDGKVGKLYNTNGKIHSRVNEYNVSVQGKDYQCSCPCFDNCKHIYALLLKIKANDDSDSEIDLIDELEKYDKDKLIDLIKLYTENDARNTIILKNYINESKPSYKPLEHFKRKSYYKILAELDDLASCVSNYDNMNDPEQYESLGALKSDIEHYDKQLLEHLKKKNIDNDQELVDKLLSYRDKLEEIDIQNELDGTIEYLLEE